MDCLIDVVTKRLYNSESGASFTSINMQYAYGQKPLYKNAAAQCNFQILVAKRPARIDYLRSFTDYE